MISGFHRTGIHAVGARGNAQPAGLLLALDCGLQRIMTGWLIVALGACTVRIMASPRRGAGPDLATVLPYVLLITAPLLSMALALHWFASDRDRKQPRLRLARIGRWRDVEADAARCHPCHGTSGLMVALLLGILVNVPLRSAEYLAAMPALSGSVPQWLRTLNLLMTFDVVLMSSLYVVAFVAGLRRMPFFPRLLAAVWLIDLAVQGVIATAAYAQPGLPGAVSVALDGLLRANVLKALIGIALWLPYLLLSKRVNVTFRHRVPA